MPRSTPIEVTPTTAGALVTRTSSENAGAYNYRSKIDFRRVLDGELVREGYDYLWPNLTIARALQSLDAPTPVTLIITARAANGRTALIAGTQTKLYRYFALENGGVFQGSNPGQIFVNGIFSTNPNDFNGVNGDPVVPGNPSLFLEADYIGALFVPGIFDENPGYWMEIGSGFSTSGKRWEADACGDYLVFNNGVDLPVTYNLFDYSEVKPIYELRESGVARVGTIGEIDGLLVCCDVTMLTNVPGWFAINAGLTYGRVEEFGGNTVRVPMRALWSDSEDPRRFAVSVPCSVSAGSRHVTLLYPAASLESGQEIILLGAGVNGSNLTTTIVNYPGGTSLVVEDEIVTSTDDSLLARSDVTGSISAYEDLIDDGSPILKALKLDGWLVLYRETSIQIADFTGNITQPFNFGKPRNTGGAGLYYRHTLVSVTFENRTWHMYAGRNGFYRFDLATRAPEQMGLFTVMQNEFFDHVTIEDLDQVWAANNGITREVFVGLPGKVICFDYERGSISTSSMNITAGATVQRPNVAQGEIEAEDWFVMAGGVTGGTLLLYGRTNQPNPQWDNEVAIWNRCGAGYDATLRSGLTHFGDRTSEKEVTEYVLFLSSITPDASVTLNFYGAQNPTETPTLLDTAEIESAQGSNLLPCHFLNFFFADELVVNVLDNPCTLAARVWSVYGVGSQSFSRRAA